MKDSKLFYVKLSEDRIAVCSYIHIKYSNNPIECGDIMKILTENNTLMREGEVPLYLED